MENLNKIFYLPSNQEKLIFFSITRNVLNILNTRSSLSLTSFLNQQKLSTLHFGLPSFTHLSMASEEDRKILCQTVEKSIEIFEHRLSHIEVEFSQYDHLKKEAKLALKAVYCSNDVVVNLVLKIAFWEFIVYD
ncbi:type VI secretion system baseplate subunit TssE [Silvanigrella aquatica]|uniref:IraD/Gp25-like domain-containing protein n=1 Tax=Silvanigrella aquatica TaxID=1915309 RepID=A0A1L4CZ16_9BACT|nr:type VI secretion system baseplate subunit TssE [Silvanigrella aquatica]APJ03192.1 hypothetical protein AXG55_04455 [Silvanigrella aquatica]